MPLLKFEVQSDYDKVVRLREEIKRLKDEASNFNIDTPQSTIKALETKLQSAQSEFNKLTNAALIAGQEMEQGFKQRIYDASNVVNDLTDKIIAQRGVLRSASADAKKYADQYRDAVKNGTDTPEMKRQYVEARQELERQKDVMFALSQEQSQARLSVRRLSDEYKLLKKDVGESTVEIDRMLDNMVSNVENKLKMGLGKGLGMLGIGMGVESFFNQMVQTRGEFQQIETSLNVLLGSEEKAADLMGKVKEFAKVSPLDLKSTAAATQMMLGFNIEAEKVPRYLSAIGDISMGDAQRFNSLTLAFSQMSATGKLMGQDLNQMINAGFNPLQILSEKTGKSIEKLKDEMSKGAISAQMVQDAFIYATDAGGKFYQMSEKASKTINGQMSMLGDAVDAMFNDMGQASEDFIVSAISGATSLVENYETVLSVLGGLVMTYGAYKATVMTEDIWSNAITNLGYDAEIESLERLLPVKQADTKTDLEQAVAEGTLTEAKAEKIKALREEAKAYMEKLAMQEESLKAEIAEATSVQMNAIQREQQIQSEIDALQEKADALFDLGDSVGFEAAQEEIATLQTDLHTASQERQTAVSRVQTAQTQLNAVATEREALANAGATTSTNILAAAKTKLIKVIEALYARVAANPWGFALAAVTALSYGIYKLITYESEYEKQTKAINATHAKFTNQCAKESEELEKLRDTLSKTKKGSDEWNQAKEEAVSKYGQYFSKLDVEIEKVGNLSTAYDVLAKNINRSMAAKELESFRNDNEIDTSDIRTKISKALQGKIKYRTNSGEIKEGTLNDERRLQWQNDIINAIRNNDLGRLSKQQLSFLSLNGRNKTMLGGLSTGYIKQVQEAAYAHGKNKKREEEIALSWGFKTADEITNGQKADDKDAIPDKDLIEARKEAEKAYKEAKKKVEDLKAGKIKGATTKDYENATTALKTAKEQANKLGIDTTDKSSKENEKALKDRDKLNRQIEDMERKNQSALTALMEDGKEKRLQTIQQEYDSRMVELRRQREDWAKENKEANVKGLDSSGLTAEQSKIIADAEEIADKQRQKSVTEIYREEAEAMRNFLSEYGTFQQQKLAITEEYAEKIRKAQTEGEKMTLAKQRDSALYKVDVSALEQRVNWGSVLGNFGTILKSQLQPTIDALKEITQTDEFKSSSIEDQSKIWEMLAKLTGENSGFNPNIFNDLANAVDDYQTSMYNLIKAQEAEASIAKEKANLEARLAKTTDSSERDHLIAMLNDLAKSASDAALLTQQYGAEVQRTSTTLNTVTTEISSNLNEFVSGLQSLTSGSLSGIWKGVESFEKVFSKDGEHKITDALAKPLSSAITKMFGPDSAPAKKLTEALGDAGLAGEIISAVFSILDILKDGIGNFIGSLIDTVLEAVNGLLKSILSLDIPMAIFNSLKDGLENILETIVDAFTLGHISSINWNGSNAKQVAETTDRLTNSNERLTHALDNLKNEINKSGGWKAISAAKEAEGTQRKINEQTAEILQTQMGYHGAHHSNAAKWNLSQADYQSLNASLSEYIAKNPNADIKLNSVGSLEDIYKLTPEQMDYIRSFNIEMWEKMITQGEYDKSEYWENYADLAGRVEDITESLKENLTQTSFDSLRSSFISSLMDMKKDANSWSDDFSEMLMASVLNARIGDLLDDDLEDFHNKWAEYSKSDSKLDAKEREELQSMWNDLTQRGLQIRDEVASFTGYDKSSTYSQSATAGYTTTISEDTGTEINGRLTAVQESHYREESLLEMSAEALQSIIKQLLDHYTIADDSRRILAECYIELVEIRKNTGAVLEPLKNIAETVEKIKKQTENL